MTAPLPCQPVKTQPLGSRTHHRRAAPIPSPDDSTFKIGDLHRGQIRRSHVDAAFKIMFKETCIPGLTKADQLSSSNITPLVSSFVMVYSFRMISSLPGQCRYRIFKIS